MSRSSARFNTFLIILAAAGCYLIGNDRVALWDRDEPRNAQAARQMVTSGDFVVPKFLGEVRTAKPVFTYWCQAAAMKVFGGNAFAARLPSAIAMTLTLIVLAIAVEFAAGAERALWSVFILATSAMVIGWSAKTSMTDAVLLLWITIAQICLYAIYRGRGTVRVVIVLAVAIGLAGLTKGPVVLGVLGSTAIVLAAFGWRPNLRDTAPKVLLAIGIIAVIVGPWFYLVNQRAPGFIGTSFSRDVIRRTFEPLEQHKGPPGYYLLMIWPMFFPWSLLLPTAIALAWRYRRIPLIRFCIAAVVGPWVMFELVQTKLPHYMLPIFPPLAILTADALVRAAHRRHDDLRTRGFLIGAAAWAAIVAACGFAPWLAAKWFDHLPIYAMTALSIAGALYAIAVFIRFQFGQIKKAAATMGIGMMAIIVLAFAWFLPGAWFLRTSICAADLLKRDGADHDVQMIAYKEPSLAFYQGGTIREQPENDFLLTHQESQWPKWLVIRSDAWRTMPPRVQEKFAILGRCRGWNYADRGRIVDVLVLRMEP